MIEKEKTRDMTKRKIVVALGGNAILSSDPSASAQKKALVDTAKHLEMVRKLEIYFCKTWQLILIRTRPFR